MSARLDSRRIGSGGSVSSAVAITIACACLLNVYSYTLVSANPLIQSDVWRFLDGFLGSFIERGFSWTDLFVEPHPAETNLPLYKLFLFFNTRYFGMDFRLEGVFAVVSAIACVVLLARLASAKPVKVWTAPEYWLLAGLALAMLSLNSTNIYTWPLATMWYVPILLACIYFGVVFRASWRLVLPATFCLGVLLDEFALPVIVAALAALLLSRAVDWGRMRATALSILAGLIISRIFYKVWELAASESVSADGLTRSLAAFTRTDFWKAVLLPLSDSVVHVTNLPLLFGNHSTLAQWVFGLTLLAAHGWFWWRVASASGRRNHDAALYIAIALMLFFYAMVAGILLQRVPELGFEYLHQPRYVLFYQLNLAALGILLYRELVLEEPAHHAWHARSVAAVVFVILFGAWQFVLSAIAWDQVKHVSRYNEQAARDMGRLAADPDAELECADFVRVCDYPVEKRRRIMSLLVRHQLNLFSPRFQSFHRLYPYAPSGIGVAPAPVVANTKSDR